MSTTSSTPPVPPASGPKPPSAGPAGASVLTPMVLEEEATLNPVAAVLAFALPGAGHAYLGETRRALLIGGGVLGMFFGGMVIGGIDVVDKREDFVWFLGQSLVGPVAFGTDYVHQHFIKVREPGTTYRRSAHPYEIRNPLNGQAMLVRDRETGEPLQFVDPRTAQTRFSTPADKPPNTKSLGRVNEIGTLFATLAGMLNLICVIDAAKRAPKRRRP